jgi:pimeloyl-ACP methyl ester carboxylesterase
MTPAIAELSGELWRDMTFSSFDDLRLHVRHYPALGRGARPAVCLPGLTRNARDFHHLASYLSHHPERPRDVYCIDYRGRGGSQRDRRWRNYTPYIELLDILDFMTVQELHRAAIIGTSRGGMIAMLMAVFRPTAIGAVVLNDIGPVIETTGLARIMGYVGRMRVPRNWDEAAAQLRDLHEHYFPALESWQWEEMARSVYNEKNGRPAQSYDRRLAKTLRSIDLGQRGPDLWPQFIALGQFPALVIRGANSDLLSSETVEAMAEGHPNLRSFIVRDQGHAPLLNDADTVETIGSFLAVND